jgi:osmotically-inducible protein OsmY
MSARAQADDQRDPFPASDEARRAGICRGAEARLRRSGDSARGDISCDAQEGIVLLRGLLRTDDLKQVAHAVVVGIEGVRGVVNLIEVVAATGRGPDGRDRAPEPASAS